MKQLTYVAILIAAMCSSAFAKPQITLAGNPEHAGFQTAETWLTTYPPIVALQADVAIEQSRSAPTITVADEGRQLASWPVPWTADACEAGLRRALGRHCHNRCGPVDLPDQPKNELPEEPVFKPEPPADRTPWLIAALAAVGGLIGLGLEWKRTHSK